MTIPTVLSYAIGWIILYGMTSLLLGMVLSHRRISTLRKSSALIYGMTVSFLLVPLLLWQGHLYTQSLPKSYWLTVMGILIISGITRKALAAYVRALKEDSSPGIFKYLFLDLLISALVISFFAVLEQYLPEYDGYIHERMGDILLRTGSIDIYSAVYRPGFLYLFSMTKIIEPTLGIFFTKFFFPTLVTFLTIQNFRVWAKLERSSWIVWLIALSSPLFISQAIYFRAQSIVALFFPLAAYTFFVRTERSLKYLFILLGIVGVLYFHIFFVFTFVLWLPFLFSELKGILGWNNREKILFLVAIFFADRAISSYLAPIWSIVTVYINFSHFSFHANPFIALVSDVTKGNFLESLKYSAHQIVFFMLVAIVCLLILKNSVRQPFAMARTSALLWMTVAAFFVLTEIPPLLGVQFDTQRIWLFTNLTLICLVAWAFANAPENTKKKATALLLVSATLSFSIVGYFVHSREKTFTPDDKDAVSYVDRMFPDSLIVGPNVKYPGIGIYKDPRTFFYISFPNLLEYGNPSVLETQIKWLSYTSSASRRKKLAVMRGIAGEINQSIATEVPVTEKSFLAYNQEVSSHSATAQPVIIYVCNNIVYCSEPGYAYDTQRKTLSSYPFLKKAYENKTVTLYQYLPSPGQPLPPKDSVLLEKIYLGSINLTEYGSQ